MSSRSLRSPRVHPAVLGNLRARRCLPPLDLARQWARLDQGIRQVPLDLAARRVRLARADQAIRRRRPRPSPQWVRPARADLVARPENPLPRYSTAGSVLPRTALAASAN